MGILEFLRKIIGLGLERRGGPLEVGVVGPQVICVDGFDLIAMDLLLRLYDNVPDGTPPGDLDTVVGRVAFWHRLLHTWDAAGMELEEREAG